MHAATELARATTAPPIERVTRALASVRAAGKFATRRTAASGDLQIDVDGVGPIPLPLPPQIARYLCDAARPARYGLRDRTLLDKRVRDAWEIDRRHVKIDERRWRRAFDPELARIGRDLGVPGGARLRAELHNLLVYGPGQFFATHQDSEKADGMIGTLVVILPSNAKGGSLVIQHHDEQVEYRGSSDRLVLAAFYADCRHEVRPVTAGYRAALTYNLFVDGSTGAAASTPSALVDAVRDYFATPRPQRWQRTPATKPERLVFLLDHEYTQKGLAWDRLKNGDATRAAMLRDVAGRLDCEVVLALADVHETWSCEDDYEYDGYGYGRRGRRWQYDEDSDVDEDDAAGAEDYTLTELCDSSIELRHWLAPSGKRTQAISDEVLDDEVCFTKPSVELEPFQTEHEGYTGNAGNTVDRWYHRAAVMLWPRARTFAIRAKASPAWAIRDIARTVARGATDVARHKIDEVSPFWSEVASRVTAPAFLDQLLHVAAEIDDAKRAAALVEPLEIERVTPRAAARCAELLSRYGLARCWPMFEQWTSREHGYGHEPRAAWVASLPELCGALRKRGGEEALELARRLARSQWTWLDKQIGQSCKRLPSSSAVRELVRLSRAIVGLLAVAELTQERELQKAIVDRLSPARDYPTRAALAVLRAGRARDDGSLGLGALHADCTSTLAEFASAPARAPGDWTIATRIRCSCDLCKRLSRFLAANDQQLEWPLAKDRRAHIHQMLDGHELPVAHVTRRVGSPHVLVLTKTKTLFTREAAERKEWASDLAWLRKTARSFGSGR